MTGRNDPCPCLSGKKWKNCHGEDTIKGGAFGIQHKVNITHDDRQRVAQVMPAFMASMIQEANIGRLERRIIKRGN